MTPRERLRRTARALRVGAGLPRADRPVFARALWTQLAWVLRRRLFARLGAPWLPAHETLGSVAEAPIGPEPEPRLLELFRLAESVLPLTPSCLPRALALGHFLWHHGFSTHLVLGVRRGPRGVEGHAWREWGSLVLEDEAFVSGFRPLRTIVGARRDDREAV